MLDQVHRWEIRVRQRRLGIRAFGDQFNDPVRDRCGLHRFTIHDEFAGFTPFLGVRHRLLDGFSTRDIVLTSERFRRRAKTSRKGGDHDAFPHLIHESCIFIAANSPDE